MLALYVSHIPLHISTGGPNQHSEGLLNQHCLHTESCSLPKVRYLEILIGLRMLTKLHLAKLIDFLLLLHKLKMSILLDARNIIVSRCPLSCPQDTMHTKHLGTQSLVSSVGWAKNSSGALTPGDQDQKSTKIHMSNYSQWLIPHGIEREAHSIAHLPPCKKLRNLTVA